MPASQVQAVDLGFECLTDNSGMNVGPPTCSALLEDQLSVAVTSYTGMPAGQVLFTFSNSAAGDASSITDVYFDDGSLLALNGLIDADDNGGSAGVDFSQGASPGNLPSGNTATPPFVATAGFTVDSDAPAQPNGVNPGESLGIFFTLQSTCDGAGGGSNSGLLQCTLADVLKDLETGKLRIGIHVQGLANGESESLGSVH